VTLILAIAILISLGALCSKQEDFRSYYIALAVFITSMACATILIVEGKIL
jgi:hypothetical protein